MYRTHDEPNWRASGWGQPEVEITEMKSKQKWFCLLVVLSILSTLSAVLIYGIFHLPLVLRIMFFAFAIISVLMHCIDKCCSKKNALDTQTETRNGIRTGTGNGITGDLDEFMFYDSRWRAAFERPNLSSSTHTRTNKYAIPTISRPTLDDLSLQRQPSLQRASLDFESRVVDSYRLPIYLSDTLSEPTNSVGTNVPSAPPLEGPLFLPSYDEVINQSNYEIEEEPPPTYDEVVLKINSNLWPKIIMLNK